MQREIPPETPPSIQSQECRARRLWLDLETYSEIPITHGVYAYAQAAEILLIAYAIDNEPAQVWDCTDNDYDAFPDDLYTALNDPGVETWAHNAAFDRVILAAAPSVGYPIARWRCTMAQAYAHSLPGALTDLCDLFKLPTDKAKDKDGRDLVNLFCKPRPATSNLRRATRETHPEQWARFVEYARLDVEAMRAVQAKMPRWNYPDNSDELALWHLDQAINDRGFLVDTVLAGNAVAAVNAEKAQLAQRTQAATGGQVEAATQRDALLKHILEAHGVDLPDLTKSTLERRVNDPELPAAVRELLALRMQASSTSTSKYETLLHAVSRGDRLRGTLQFCGATRTGRWAGRIFQPQNMPRPNIPKAEIAVGIDAIKAGCADLVTDNVTRLAANTIRGCIIAPAGKKLVVADLANIEGRVLAWLAGETWKLKAFRAFDAGDGFDLYKLAYAKAFGVNPEQVTPEQRQIGKVMELALGYAGGVGAFVQFAQVYNLDLDAMADSAYATIPPMTLAETRRRYEWTRQNKIQMYGLPERAWIVCDALKSMWRESNSKIVGYWQHLEQEFSHKAAEQNPWLTLPLPSGRQLCYPQPRSNDTGLSYAGANTYTRAWSRIKTYGGKLAENITQAVSRDVMARAMPFIENAGYEIVLTVHDEVITEAPDAQAFNAQHLAQIMTINPYWAQGLPLAAAGFEAYRYRKD